MNNKYSFLDREHEVVSGPFDNLLKPSVCLKSSVLRPVRDDIREASPLIPDISNYENSRGDLVDSPELDVKDVGLVERNDRSKPDVGSVKRLRIPVKGFGAYSEVSELETYAGGREKISVRPVGWKDSLGEIILFRDKYVLADHGDDLEYDDLKSAAIAMWSNFLKKTSKVKKSSSVKPGVAKKAQESVTPPKMYQLLLDYFSGKKSLNAVLFEVGKTYNTDSHGARKLLFGDIGLVEDAKNEVNRPKNNSVVAKKKKKWPWWKVDNRDSKSNDSKDTKDTTKEVSDSDDGGND